MENFIKIYKVNESLCDDLIKYHKDNSEYKMEGVCGNGNIDKNIKESIDVIFFNQSKNETILNFFNVLSQCLFDYTNQLEIPYKLITDITNIIQYYPPNGGFKVYHSESECVAYTKRKLVYMLYLNNVSDGGTEFKHQQLKLNAIKGDLIIWPADFTHTHRGIVSKTNEKYIVTGWFNIV